MVRKHILIIAVMVLATILISTSLWAVPNRINYQGKITDKNGIALEGAYIMTFHLYTGECTGNPVWSEQKVVTMKNGVFDIQLGSDTPLSPDLFTNNTLSLGIDIFNQGIGWESFYGCQPLTSTSFAMKAEDADTLNGKDSGEFAEAAHTHDAGDIISGILDNSHISAYSDLGAEGHLDNDSDTDLLIRSQTDARFVNEGQADSITSCMIGDGQVTSNDMEDGSALSEILDDDGSGSKLDADLLDGKDSTEFLDTSATTQTKAGGLNIQGNVGIGTMNPSRKLEVECSSGNTVLALNNTADDGDLFISWMMPDILEWIAGVDDSDSDKWKLAIGGDISAPANNRLTITTGGNVGIGKTNPAEKLDVKGAIAIDGTKVIDENGKWVGTPIVKPGAGCLGLYTKDNIFLGYLVDRDTIYNSDIPGYLYIELDSLKPYVSVGNCSGFYYLTDNCTGQRFVRSSKKPFTVFKSPNEDKYFVVDGSVQPIKNMYSYDFINNDGTVCTPFNDHISEHPVSPAREIEEPFKDIELEHPLVIKLIE